jgi:hypothetical protein
MEDDTPACVPGFRGGLFLATYNRVRAPTKKFSSDALSRRFLFDPPTRKPNAAGKRHAPKIAFARLFLFPGALKGLMGVASGVALWRSD